jgi:hydrogenase-4 component B
MFPIAGALLALTAALAAACFVKAFGIPFLALPRSEAAARRAGGRARHAAGMALLAAACFALGLGATWILPVFDPITQQALGGRPHQPFAGGHGIALQAGTRRAAPSPRRDRAGVPARRGLRAFFLVVCAAPRARATGPTWDCGLPGLTADNEYTATAFSKPCA